MSSPRSTHSTATYLDNSLIPADRIAECCSMTFPNGTSDAKHTASNCSRIHFTMPSTSLRFERYSLSLSPAPLYRRYSFSCVKWVSYYKQGERLVDNPLSVITFLGCNFSDYSSIWVILECFCVRIWESSGLSIHLMACGSKALLVDL